MATPEVKLATAIGSAVASLTYGTNLFTGPVRPAGDGIPAKCCFVLSTGGPAPDEYIGETEVHRYSALQVRYRGDKGDHDGGLAIARSIRDACQHASLAGYIDCRTQESEPNYLGTDSDGHPEWSINVETEIKE